MNGECKLCLNNKKLRNSHIIPEFMYQNIYDKKPRRFNSLTVNLSKLDSAHKKFEQQGIREFLLCGECEVLLSKYEKYASETIYAKNQNSKVFSVKIYRIPGTTKIVQEFAGLVYKDFKLFLLSILWRIIISKEYKIQIADEEIKEKLRVAILNHDPLNYKDFGCIIQAIKNDTDELVSGFIHVPSPKIINNFKMIEVLIDGFMYSFFLNSNELPEGQTKFFLNQNGSMNILYRKLSEDVNLSRNLKTMLELLGYSDDNENYNL
jgi:hypothetical protein